MPLPLPLPRSLAHDPDFFHLLLASHARVVGTPLLTVTEQALASPRWLCDDAPFCLLAHDTDADPRFIYGNRTALRCFEYDWDELTALRSRQSAADDGSHAQRAKLFESVQARGFATGYRGLRVAKSGRRFWIEDVTVWNMLDEAGVRHGQAAAFRRWSEA
jgi:hypothetical protein